MLLQFSAPFATKMVPVGGPKCCAGGGIRRVRRASLYHRKVSTVEPPPGVSGLTSTLMQATFSWLFYRKKEDKSESEQVQIYGGAKGEEQWQM